MRRPRRGARPAATAGPATSGSLPAVDPGTIRSRRRFARRQWRRRWLAWRYLLVALLLVALVGAAVWALWFSTWLTVKGVDIAGTEILSEGEVRRAAGVERGEQLVSVDLDAVRARVAALAPVESVEVTRQWPDEVRVDVTERTPIAVIQIGDKLRALDSHGVVFHDYRDAPGGLPRVVTPAGTDRDALREAAEVVEALPSDVAIVVEHVDVKTVDQITLELTDGRRVVWGSAEDSTTKGRVLAGMLQQPGQIIDVSVPGQPTACVDLAVCG